MREFWQMVESLQCWEMGGYETGGGGGLWKKTLGNWVRKYEDLRRSKITQRSGVTARSRGMQVDRGHLQLGQNCRWGKKAWCCLVFSTHKLSLGPSRHFTPTGVNHRMSCREMNVSTSSFSRKADFYTWTALYGTIIAKGSRASASTLYPDEANG